MSTKMCCRCREAKPLVEFSKRAKSSDGLAHACRTCLSADERARYLRDPQARRARQRELRASQSPEQKELRYRRGQARLYGLTLAEYDAILLEADGHPCPICGTTMSKDGGQRSRPCFDHCHDTGRFRRVICSPCNTGLGMFKDDPAVLRRAANYLEVV